MINYPDFKVCVRCFTYNHARFIEDTMNGFCLQKTTFPYVCCIVDDASTDNNAQIIDYFIRKNFDTNNLDVAYERDLDYGHLSFAQHVDNKNCYFVFLALKQNHGSVKKGKLPYLKEWTGSCDYQALCEGDDYWIYPEKLQRQVDFLEVHKELSYSCTRYYDLQQDTGAISLHNSFYFGDEIDDQDYFIFDRNEAFMKGYEYSWITKTLTCVYRSDSLRQSNRNRFPKTYRDIHMVYDILSHGNGVCHGFVGGVYRISDVGVYRSKTMANRIKWDFDVYSELNRTFHDPAMEYNERLTYYYLICCKVFIFPKSLGQLKMWAVFFFRLPKLLFNKYLCKEKKK